MVNLDLLFFVLLLLCFAYGMLRGFLRMLVSLAALIIGSLAVWLLNVLVDYSYMPGFLSTSMSGTLLGTAFFALVYIIALAIGGRLIKTRALAFSKGTADRLIGGVFSLCLDAAILLLLIWFFDCIGEDLLRKNERVRDLWSESRVCQWAHDHNPICSITPVRRLEGFLVAARDQE
ncbi:MAG: CvpA family protein, partial [bacterium]